MPIKVRFAPSPTGDLHVGGVRTALYNFLYARANKGVFVLRIEDTDQKRNRDESLASIKDGLEWCGLRWDEGPFYQSLRLDRYKECAKQLEDAGRAYWQEDPEKGKALRFRIDRGPCVWKDLIHGDSRMDTTADPDLVIIKSDGFPTYNFAVVVDDHDMGITHVLRADEHYSNTPKQIALYKALGWTPPNFGHMPIIKGPDDSKLSKRDIDKWRAQGLPITVGVCRELGYLPEAVVNFLSLLGWSPGKDVELMSIDEMISKFTLERVGNTPAKFMVDKLQWMNAHYIKKTPVEKLVALCRPYLATAYDLSTIDDATLHEAVRQQQGRLKMLRDIVGLTKFCFAPAILPDPKAEEKWLKGSRDVLVEIRAGLDAMKSFDKEPIEALLKGIAERRGLKMANVAQPLRVAITGTDQSPSMHETLALVGRERAFARIDAVLRRL